MKVKVDRYFYTRKALESLLLLEDMSDVTLENLAVFSDCEGIPIMLGDYDPDTDTVWLKHPVNH